MQKQSRNITKIQQPEKHSRAQALHADDEHEPVIYCISITVCKDNFSLYIQCFT